MVPRAATTAVEFLERPVTERHIHDGMRQLTLSCRFEARIHGQPSHLIGPFWTKRFHVPLGQPFGIGMESHLGAVQLVWVIQAVSLEHIGGAAQLFHQPTGLGVEGHWAGQVGHVRKGTQKRLGAAHKAGVGHS